MADVKRKTVRVRPASKGTEKTSRSTRAPARKRTDTKAPSRKVERVEDEYGFAKGSDLSIVAGILVKGGKGRSDVVQKVERRFAKKTTRNGKPKNAHSLVAITLAKMQERGYKIEESWIVTPPKRRRKTVAATTETDQAA